MVNAAADIRKVLYLSLLLLSPVASFLQPNLAQRPLLAGKNILGQYEQRTTIQSTTAHHYYNNRPSLTTSLKSSSTDNNNNNDDDVYFDIRTTLSLVAGQSFLIVIAVLSALYFKIPNYGFGPNISFNNAALLDGCIRMLPFVVVAFLLDFVEKSVPALQDVTKATQRSILALLGGKFKPVLAITVSIALGLSAGFGEEMLFRGIMQTGFQSQLGDTLSLVLTAVIFGLLHAVTPIYAILAGLAGAYFGWIYQVVGNLAVPITTHAVYDIGALLYAHWTVAQMTEEEQQALNEWEPYKRNEELK